MTILNDGQKLAALAQLRKENTSKCFIQTLAIDQLAVHARRDTLTESDLQKLVDAYGRI